MDNEKHQLIKIADMYYNRELTQQQIANALGISRMKVSRLLQKSKDRGIVKISIDFGNVFVDLEREIEEKYHLRNVIVVSGVTDDTKNEIASAAAFYLNNSLRTGDQVAIGWGTTMRSMVAYCEGDFKRKVQFSPIIGGHGKSELNLHASTIASDLSKRFNGTSLSLLAPAFVDSQEDKTSLVKDSYVQEVLAASRKANKAVFSLGNPAFSESSIHRAGYFSDKDLMDIKAGGVICDIISIAFLNSQGELILKNLTDRSIGITEQDLKAIPEKICLAGGTDKHEAIKVAIQAGFVDTLITDHETAEYLMQ